MLTRDVVGLDGRGGLGGTASGILTPLMRALGAASLGRDGTRVLARLDCRPPACTVDGSAVDLRAVAALLDHVGGAAVYAAIPGLQGTATLELRLDIVGAPVPGQAVFARAECTSLEAGSALVLGTAWCGDATAATMPVARLTGRFVVGVGPGQVPGAEDRHRREARAAAHVPVIAPAADCFDALLGGTVDGTAFLLPGAPWLVGSIALPALHGGTVAAGLMQAARQAAAVAPGLALKSLGVQYLRASHVEETRFGASVVKRGQRAAYIDAEATQRQGERRVARMQCLYA
ncbi:acyl-CoA thioesterase domain-containing protein [Piscinibacter sakaiensis]|uniref:Acyl-CoA thioesterase-like N-terminal HotDog domain-containing protein n=1 Tax=Piscinibacter sakaiensis TaxID=1547922 RepID=A0A0K8P3J6_PISS1|nr:acyl-CoA thioesterase domain-containing protein [Piscinibacter sakaiensis]GAP37144.1 hypothetical protein ISF6_2999 [Piscinibacter sakaiensis]